jgi:hypothetical protein
MTFNIRDFSSKIKEHGLAKSNLFIVEIGVPATIRNELRGIPVINDIRFYCRSVTLPEMDLITTDIQVQGFGSPQRRPQGMNFPIIPAIFMVDSEFGVMKFFHRWTQAIINYDRSGGDRAQVNNQLPFEMGYKKEYETTMKITVFSFGDGGGRSKNSVYEYTFGGVYPVNVGNIAEDWEDHADVMILPVGFTYDTMKVTGAKPPRGLDFSELSEFGVNGTFDGTGGRRGPLSAGLMSWFSSINGTAQAIRGISRPQNIQDAINQITTVSTIARAFK